MDGLLLTQNTFTHAGNVERGSDSNAEQFAGQGQQHGQQQQQSGSESASSPATGMQIQFYPCPTGYCCAHVPPRRVAPAGYGWYQQQQFDCCFGARGGILCSECGEGFGEVYGSTACQLNSKCGDRVCSARLCHCVTPLRCSC